MKRSGFLKRGTKQMKRTGFKKKPRKLRTESKDATPLCKKRIQALLRLLVIERDGGCVLRHYSQSGACGGFRSDGELILQAEHLNTRSRNVSFGDLRNIVCLCQRHHLYFKPQHSQLYWELIEKHLDKKTWKYYKKVRDDQKAYKMVLYDWQKLEMSLTQDLKKGDN